MKVTEHRLHMEYEPETREEYEQLAKEYPTLIGCRSVCVAKPFSAESMAPAWRPSADWRWNRMVA